jgi:hypothetical protein
VGGCSKRLAAGFAREEEGGEGPAFVGFCVVFLFIVVEGSGLGGMGVRESMDRLSDHTCQSPNQPTN